MPSFTCRSAHEGPWHCVSSWTDWYKNILLKFCFQAQRLKEQLCAQKGVCSGYFLHEGKNFHLIALSTSKKAYALDTSCIALSTRQKAYASDTSCHCPEHSPKGVCAGDFLPKGTKFHLIALSTRHKAYARESKVSMLFLNKSYAKKTRASGEGYLVNDEPTIFSSVKPWTVQETWTASWTAANACIKCHQLENHVQIHTTHHCLNNHHETTYSRALHCRWNVEVSFFFRLKGFKVSLPHMKGHN